MVPMESRRRGKTRFSLLLLEEGDVYIRDWMASCYTSSMDPPRVTRGRLRLCARSVFFDPDDSLAPIVMLPFRTVRHAKLSTSPGETGGSWSGGSRGGGVGGGIAFGSKEGLLLEAGLTVEMKAGGMDVPYNFSRSVSQWWFCLDYVPTEQLVQQVADLLLMRDLPYGEQEIAFKKLVARIESSAVFDTSRLIDLGEHVIFDCSAAQMTPLVREPGRFVITQARVYFQPLHNFGEGNPVRSFPLTEIVTVARRTHVLRPRGLEIFLRTNLNSSQGQARNSVAGPIGDTSSFLYIFASEKAREKVLAQLTHLLGGSGERPDLMWPIGGRGQGLHQVTAAWQRGEVGNYDYLLYLNIESGRSFNDLTQWPVMPWVLSDYKSPILDLTKPTTFRDFSKPIGALNSTRLKVFKNRYDQMADGSGGQAPFLYGTHYSAPGYVLFWLVRTAPAHMLRLQNGRFDAPDRLFCSLLEAWESVLSNPTDVKELIPEFFSPPSDFLSKRDGLNLGVKQNGEMVGDVKLPLWADGPEDFLEKHFAALECDWVSAHLHHWIDLIFGFRQRGEAALEADNLFHPLTYEGTVNLDTVSDPMERMALEAQINEFGQTPRQLFSEPHPARPVSTRFKSGAFLKAQLFSGGNKTSSVLTRIMSHTMPNSIQIVSPELNSLKNASQEMITSQNLLVESHSSRLNNLTTKVGELVAEKEYIPKKTMESRIQEEEINEVVSKQKGNSPSLRISEKREKCQTDDVAVEEIGGSVGIEESMRNKRKENGMFLKDALDKGPLVDYQKLTLHRDAVQALLLSQISGRDFPTAYSVGRDAFLKVHSLEEGEGEYVQLRAAKLGNLPLTSLTLLPRSDSSHPLVLSGSYDCGVWVYSVEYGRCLGRMPVHDDTVSCLKIPVSGKNVLTGSWDSTVRLWSVDESRSSWTSAGQMEPILEMGEHESGVYCLDVDLTGNLVLSGAQDGTVIAWDIRNPPDSSAVWKTQLDNEAVMTVKICGGEGEQAIAATADGNLRLLEMRLSGAEVASYDCRSPLLFCEIAGGVAIAGSENGQLHFWGWSEASRGDFPSWETVTHHNGPVSCGAYMENDNSGGTLATGSHDCSVNVYKIMS